MKTSRSKLAAALCSAGLLGAVAFFATFQTDAQAQQAKGKAGAVTPGGLFNGYISGTVTGEKGPEAGVWVISETKDLLTNFIKIVVTDDRGRFVLPELPSANYKVWVRGYGLVDSPKVKAQPGKALDLKSVQAPNRAAAAQYYPGVYWYAMMKIPAAKASASAASTKPRSSRPKALASANPCASLDAEKRPHSHYRLAIVTRYLVACRRNAPDSASPL